MSPSEFTRKFDQGEPQVLSREIPSDLLTPVAAYLKLCAHQPHCFLLESVEGGNALGRYSIIGLNPDLIWTYEKDKVHIYKDGQKIEPKEYDVLQSLRQTIEESSIKNIPSTLPPMCAFGLFGYIGYDMIRLVEKIPDNNPDTLGVPDSVLMRPSILAIFDNVKNKIILATPVYEHAQNSENTAQNVYENACMRLDQAEQKLNAPLDHTLTQNKTKVTLPLEVTSYTSQNEYESCVAKAIDYIRAGEIFQVVPSQRFSVPFDLPAFELYRSLRSVNPSPFLFHLNFDGFALVGSSPEILVRVRDNTVTIRPIAGTRKRGENASEDQALADDLLSDEKECAEHLMLLDLGRNDVGRVAEIGSVSVTEKFQVEYYSHVMHIVSNVQGKLKTSTNIIDALFAGFPAGTVSGAPKIRAMEIIDELEPLRRMTYAGGIGYFSDNAMDSCIALRTALVKDRKVYAQAGAGVVADSIPAMEHQECVNKAKAIISAAELAVKRNQ